VVRHARVARRGGEEDLAVEDRRRYRIAQDADARAAGTVRVALARRQSDDVGTAARDGGHRSGEDERNAGRGPNARTGRPAVGVAVARVPTGMIAEARAARAVRIRLTGEVRIVRAPQVV